MGCQAVIRLCILMGMPPEDLTKQLGIGPIPIAPATVVAGIPADLLRQRPDVRRAERLAAAQAEQIGIAEAALYPIFSIDGTLGWQAGNFSQLFTPGALSSSVGPAFSWQILNYGRIVNNMHYQDAKFRELVVAYQAAVLQANAEVEAGMSVFLHAQERTVHLDTSVACAKKRSISSSSNTGWARSTTPPWPRSNSTCCTCSFCRRRRTATSAKG